MNLYFDESIRDSGNFILGAMVLSERDLSALVRKAWVEMGLDSDFEYKSSALKLYDARAHGHRAVIRRMLMGCDLSLLVCPSSDRHSLGQHCAKLVLQLQRTGHLAGGPHELFVDENIFMPRVAMDELTAAGVVVHLQQNSKIVGGLQVADHAAHALGGMLLEEMGLVKKLVRAGENSGYHPEQMLELGFELWASLRYALVGKNEHIAGLSPPADDPANPYFRVDGHGLYIAPSCPPVLAAHARDRFGVNYLGCIH
jgi:hypothetical protein